MGSAAKENPFAVRWERRRARHAAVNKRPGIGDARARAEEKRRATLGVERRERRKSNVFADRRIGESDQGLTDEDRNLARFQRERSRRLRRRAAFHLDGDDAEVLTHAGRPLDDLDVDGSDGGGGGFGQDDGDDSLEPDDEAEVVDKFHFGGLFEPVDPQTAEKTHAQVMAEVVAKSKMHKAERQQERQHVEAKTDRLDEHVHEFVAQLPKLAWARDAAAAGPPVSGTGVYEEDDYDKMFALLAAEKRSAPSERMKKPAEIAAEEKERLEKLERQRLRRMRGVEDDDEAGASDGGASDDLKAGGDDLDDGFQLPSDSDGSEDDTVNDDPERAGDEVAVRSVNGNATTNGFHTNASASDSEVETLSKQVRDDDDTRRDGPAPKHRLKDDVSIPFVFKTCPTTNDELLELFRDLTARQRAIVLERLHKCFAVSAGKGGRDPLRNLLRLLLRRVSEIAGDGEGDGAREVEAIVPRIHALGVDVPEIVCGWARKVVAECRDSVNAGGYGRLLRLEKLVLFRSLVRLFPTSDFRHPVLTPTSILVAETLLQAPFASLHDTVAGTFLASIMVSMTSSASKVTTELLVFLASVLGGSSFMSMQSQSYLRMQSFREGAHLCPAKISSVSSRTLTKLTPLTLWDYHASKSMEVPELHAKVFLSALHCVNTLVQAWSPSQLPSARTILQPLSDAITSLLRESQHPDILLSKLRATQAAINELLGKCERERRPLALFARKVAPRKLLNPKVAEPSRRRHDPRRQTTKADLTRLKKRLRSEERSAGRELQRDAAFLQRENLNEADTENTFRERKRNEAMSMLEDQERTWKQQVKKKRKMSNKW